MSNDFLFTSESVSEGHPDKVADQISDAILDAIFAQDPRSRVAAETLCNTGLVVLAGEITTNAHVDYIQVARDTIKRIGYDNTIPLFAPREQLKKLIGGIVTDSRAPGEPKETAGSALFQIYQAFASEQETTVLRNAFAEGIAWGEAKQILFDRIDCEVAPMREHYAALLADPGSIETILQQGAAKARQTASPFMAELRHAVGLRRLAAAAPAEKKDKVAKVDAPSFKQYRESDGRFYFKLLDARARLLLQSHGFEAPKDAALAIKALQNGGAAALVTMNGMVTVAPDVQTHEVQAALNYFLQPTV